MSDTSTPAAEQVVGTTELTAEPEAAKGGLIKGPDGKLSGRKLIGLGAAVAGAAAGAWGIAKGADWKLVGVVMGLLLGLSVIMYGFLTAQNGKALIAAWKGNDGASA